MSLPDGDRVQAFLEELGRYDRRIGVRLTDRRLKRLDDRVVVSLVEVDQRDEILLRRLGLRRQYAVPVGLPPAAAPAGEQIAGVDGERVAVGKAIRRALARVADADAVIGEHLRQTVRTGVRCSYWPD